MRERFLLFFFSFSCVFAFAQKLSISGTVKDGSGQPLPGVNVFIQGTKIATTTDFDGNYQIKASKDDVLVYSYVGMKQQLVVVADATTIDVVLEEDSAELSEVVVTALGISRDRKKLGYAVQSVKSEKLNLAGTTNINNALVGKVSGVQIMSRSDANLDGTPSVRVRGVNTIDGFGTPLYVVDGTPILDPASINMDDVAEMSVLKGASASALYGSRAVNGVILITTKKAKGGKLEVSVTNNFTVSKVARWYDDRFQNEYGGGYTQEFDKFQYVKGRDPDSWAKYDKQPVVNYAADESWGPRFEGQKVRHWDSWYPGDEFGKLRAWEASPTPVSSFFDTGINNRIAANVARSGKMYNARLSYTNVNVKGVLPLSKSNQNFVTARIKLDLSKSFAVEGSINYTKKKVQGDFSNTGYGNATAGSFDQWYQRQLDLNRLKKYKQLDKDGRTVYRTWNITGPRNLRPSYWDSPYRDVNDNKRTRERTYLTGFLSLEYKIGETITLKALSRNSTGLNALRQYNSGTRRQDFIDSYEKDESATIERNHEFLATYQDRFLDDHLSVDGLLGANLRNETYNSTNAGTNGGLSFKGLKTLNNSVAPHMVFSNSTEKEVRSLYGSLNLGYNEFLFVEASLRSDWSSTLPESNNNFTYPSFSGSFVVSKLLRDLNVLPDFISFGKIRASWAQVGADTGPGMLQPAYFMGFASYMGNSMQNLPPTKPAENLKPALTTSTEFGVEMKFLDNRLGFDVAYYNNVNTDQILNVPVSGISGYTSANVNAGKIVNKGWELSLNVVPLRTTNLSWNVDFNLSQATPIVEELAPEKGLTRLYLDSGSRLPSYAYAREGKRYGAFRGDVPKMINGKPVLGTDGRYQRETDPEKMWVENKFSMPDYTGGFATSVNYTLPKNMGSIVLAAAFDFRIGGYIVDNNKRNMNQSGLSKETVGTNALGNRKRDLVKDKSGKLISNGYGAVKVSEAHKDSGGIRVDGVDQSGKPVSYYVHPKTYYNVGNAYAPYHALYDASYLKLRELNLSYNVPKSWLDAIKATSASIGIVVRDYLLIKDSAISIDPSQTSDIRPWLSWSQLPSTETMGLNVSINF